MPRFDDGNAQKLPNDIPLLMNGTGWLIAPELIVTNYHVVNARENGEQNASADDIEALGTTVSFDYDSDGGATMDLSAKALETIDRDLDYAILRLATKPPNRTPLRVNSQEIAFLPSTYLPVNIIQHPRGTARKVAFRNNLLSGVDETTIRCFSDTDRGTSGSPVCDGAWRVPALHRGAVGVSNVSSQGESTAFVNFGTQIQAVSGISVTTRRRSM